MADPVSPRAWRIAIFVLMAGGLAFAIRPLLPDQGPENWFPEADKVHHLWFFGLLWWLGLKAGFRAGWPLAFGLLAYGVGIELAQALSPSRAASMLDLVADSAGIAIGWCAARFIARPSRREPEKDRG